MPRGRGGEGENHKTLRLWVKENPEQIDKEFHSFSSLTEVELLSGDRVDVVLYGEGKIVAIEVKSRDSEPGRSSAAAFTSASNTKPFCALRKLETALFVHYSLLKKNSNLT